MVNMKVPFKGFNGEPIKEDGRVMDMAEYIGLSLFGMSQLEREQMMTAYNIVKKIQQDPEKVSLEDNEKEFLKTVMAQKMTIGCYGQLCELLK